MANEEYKVAGYNVRSDYDAPYHPTADFDPAVKFAHAGDVETAAAAAAAEYANEHADEFNDDPAESEPETPVTTVTGAVKTFE